MNETCLNDKLKYALVEMYKRVVDEVEPKYIMDLLIEKKVVSIEEREEIMAHNTRQERCRAMLHKLFITSNPEAFVVLREAFQQNHHWIVKKLDAQSSLIKIEQEGDWVKKQCTSMSESGKVPEKKNSESMYVHVEKLTNMVTELQEQLKGRDEEIANLNNHIMILDQQLEAFRLANKREDLTQDGKNHIGNDDDVSTFTRDSFTQLAKLPRYCGSTFDLWIGRFGETDQPVYLKELTDADKDISHFPELNLLRGLEHPRITNLLGKSPPDAPSRFVVLEASPLANSLKYLKRMHFQNFALSTTLVVEWIVQMASGIEYLHDNRIIHRSIFATNLILCNSGNSVKITNFQNATSLMDRNYLLESGPLSRAEYTAPEVISSMRWSSATDVWSFGLTALKIWIMGNKIFPEMTQRDIVKFFAEAGQEQIAEHLDRHTKNDRRFNETIRRCLSLDENDRPAMTELTSFHQYVDSACSDFGNKRKLEQMINCKKPVRGITSLSGMLYVIRMNSSSIKCYDISDGLMAMESIKLWASKNHEKPKYAASKNLQSLCGDDCRQSLFLLDYGHSKVLKIAWRHCEARHCETRHYKVRHWPAPPGAECLSLTSRGSVLIGCCSSEHVAFEYNVKGHLLSKVSGGRKIDEPLRVLKLDELHFLILHGNVYSSLQQKLCVVDSDGTPSSGHLSIGLNSKVTDVVVHASSGRILLADATGNRILSVDRYLETRTKEFLNVHDGIQLPSCLHSDGDRLYVGLTNGNVYCFEIS